MEDPVRALLDRQGVAILDGGLATELENRGYDLRDALWSARLLLDDPGAVRAVHRDYVYAGADCVITASYQASAGGFSRRGLDAAATERLLRLSVELACAARDEFWRDAAARAGRARPLVAASVGPYGAARADGSEYTGAYDLDEAGLVLFHERRLAVLADAGADLLACETIPALAEARALARVLERRPGVRAWMSFTLRDAEHLSDGTPLGEVVAAVRGLSALVAVGVNCVPPAWAEPALFALRRVIDVPLVAYPNSGEEWDATARGWRGTSAPGDFGAWARTWRAAGAALIGGCCRTGPGHVRAVRAALLPATDGTAAGDPT